MESSELVQRLQAQVLELRADNCEFKERDKYSKKKLNEIDQQREELEKQLKSELRKNKALSFLPGQSARDEIIKLQNELDIKCNQLQQQEYDFQQHDMALRDEINSLSRQIRQLETSPQKKPTKSNSTIDSKVTHPLSDINDSGILDSDELEKNLLFEKDKNGKLQADNEQKHLAIKELENIVRTLRTDKEDQLEELNELDNFKKKLVVSEELAVKRKNTSDDLASQIYELNQQLKNTKTENASVMEKIVLDAKAKNATNVGHLKTEIKELNEARKLSELRMIDSNRRLDELLQSNKELQKELRSVTQTKEFLDRRFEEEKIEKSEFQSNATAAIENIQELKLQIISERESFSIDKGKLKLQLANSMTEFDCQKVEISLMNKKIQDELRSAIDDEVEKQRIVERKAAVTVRELKKQVQAEKKRADKLQDKIRDIDENQIVEHERLSVPKTANTIRDETSSIGSWSLPTEFDGLTILTGQEAEDILQKNRELMETKLQLEEQLRALEKNQIQMSEELANREEILRARIWHTRADAQKQAKSAPGLSDLVINKIIEFAGEPNNVHEQNPVQLKALNKKLLRMLEEEMTKNLALRKNIEQLTLQLEKELSKHVLK